MGLRMKDTKYTITISAYKILLSIASFGVMFALLTGTTFAYFSTSGSSLDNSIQAGNISLLLSDDNQTSQASVDASFGGIVGPGTCTGNQSLLIKNSGSIQADHVQITLSNSVDDQENNASPDMDSYLKINSLSYDGNSVLSQVSDLNGNLYPDLYDFAHSTGGLDNLALTDIDVNHELIMDVCLDENVPLEIQSDSITSTFNVELNQDNSQ